MRDQDAGLLGILGGMGPLAGAAFASRLVALTPVERDQDHVPALLCNDPRVPDRSSARLAQGEDPLDAMLGGLRLLERAGATLIAIPCNTVHGWHGQMAAATALPILHIVDAAAEDLARQGIHRGRIGVMGTAGTLAMRLYQERLEGRGYDCIVPDAAEMEALVSPGIALVKANRVAEAYSPLAEAARNLRARGAAAVVLGCTEIPLGIQAGPHAEIGLPLVDTIDALALAALRWAGR